MAHKAVSMKKIQNTVTVILNASAQNKPTTNDKNSTWDMLKK